MASAALQGREILTREPGRSYRPLLYAAAIVFAAAAVLYSAAWMYYIRRPVQVEIGVDTKPAPEWLEITSVYKNSPAETAGLKTNDRIVAINGKGGPSAAACDQLLYRTWLASKPGDTVTLTVQRPGQSQPLVITPVFPAIHGVGDT